MHLGSSLPQPSALDLKAIPSIPEGTSAQMIYWIGRALNMINIRNENSNETLEYKDLDGFESVSTELLSKVQ